jgi:hypothetical protein
VGRGWFGGLLIREVGGLRKVKKGGGGVGLNALGEQADRDSSSS